MEPDDSTASTSRKSLRTVNTGSIVDGEGGATGSESPRSETGSEGRARTSSRLNNPEFAAKHKAFMAKVTAASKGSMDSYLSTEMVAAEVKQVVEATARGTKRRNSPKTDEGYKRRRSTKTNSSGLDVLSDGYCWVCHKEGDVICCETCPRVFHFRCVNLDASPAEDWVCPECVLIMTAENLDTRSRAMRLLTVDQLCTLLKHALTRMKSVINSEPFVKPVDPVQFPAYKDYISCPMDLQSMERNIRRKQYGSTEAMLADCKWILHNCIIFNSPSSKLTTIAKHIVKVCKHEMQEVENCPDCYLNAHIKKDTWFTEACRFPHPIVWAKLKGFPFWPGKIMRVNSESNADIRFFGAHDRAWIPLRDVFLYSAKPPQDLKKKRGNLDTCVGEVENHLNKINERFGQFNLAPHKTQYDPTKEEEMLKILFPTFLLPFDIGSITRRARSYSFTGSERSREATPTPSESSIVDEEDDFEEEEYLAEKKVGKYISKAEISHTKKESGDKVVQAAIKKDVIQNNLNLNFEDENNEQMQTEVEFKPDDKLGEDCENKLSVSEEAKLGLPALPTAVEETVQSPMVELRVSVTESTRVSASPPCEVTSTTLTPGLPGDLEQSSEQSGTKIRIIEGIIAETSERVIIEEEEELEVDEIDDVEPVVDSKVTAEFASSIEDESEMEDTNNKKIDNSAEHLKNIDNGKGQASPEEPKENAENTTEEIDDVEPSSEEEQSLDPTKLLASGVSITVIDKKQKTIDSVDNVETKENKGLGEDTTSAVDLELGSDISVTVVQKQKQSDNEMEKEKDAKFTISLKSESELMEPERKVEKKSPFPRKSLTEECDKSPPDPIVTISKVSAIKDTKVGVVSPPVVTGKNSPAPSPGPIMGGPRGVPLGFRGPHLMRPRGAGPMMNMMPGPPQPNMLRGPPFRGPHPGPHGMPPMGLPNLQPRPGGPLSAPPSLPSSAGPVADQLNKVAGKLAVYMRQNLEDLFKDLSSHGSPEATIKGLQLEMEKMAWRQQQELAEVKHNADLILMEMRSSMEQDKQRTLADARKQAEIEKQKAILETKKKQWCAACGKEAIFYCCWNTSYCDYPCQQAHWPNHMASCNQNSQSQENSAGGESEEAQAPSEPGLPSHHFLAGGPSRGSVGPRMSGPGHSNGLRGALGGPRMGSVRSRAPGPGVPSNMAGMRFNIRPSMPPYSRPYFM